MVHLKPMLASAILFLLIFALVFFYIGNRDLRSEMVEANSLSAEIYDMALVAKGSSVTLAYKTQVLHIDGRARWDGSALVGAYNMAFRQECQSLWSEEIQAKLWRDKWVQASATSPHLQVEQWLQMVRQGKGSLKRRLVKAAQILPLGEGDARRAITIKLRNVPLDWNALTDVCMDSLFGSQAFLTEVQTGNVTLCFDADSYLLIGVVISASSGQTSLTETIVVSTADGHTLDQFPLPDELSEGTLYEEWSIVNPEEE